MYLAPHPRDLHRFVDRNSRPVRVKMSGAPRRVIYWPDEGQFKVYEDSQRFEITDVLTGKTSEGYGTKQSGFRVGSFDPSLGGCG